MIFKTVVVLTLLSLLDAVVFKKNHEYVYSYEGRLKIGTEKLSNYYSYSKIRFDAHIKSLSNENLWISFENVNCSAFSGSEKKEKFLKTLALPEDSKALKLPFVYNGYSNTNKKGINTKSEDEKWSRNMKQAFVNLLHFDEKVFESDSQTFTQNGFDYYVLSDENSINVTKVSQKDEKSEKIDGYITEEHLEMPSYKKHSYKIIKSNGEFILNSVKAMGIVDYSPFNGEGEYFYVSVDQKLDLKHEKLSETDFHEQDDLIYNEFDLSENVRLKESELIEIDYSMEKSEGAVDMKIMKEKLTKLAEYLKKSHLTMKKPAPMGVEYVDHYIYFLEFLNENNLKELYSMVSQDEDLTQLFLKLVSLTGTSSSYLFIVDLVLEKKVNDDLVVDVFQNMAAHPVNITEILKDKLLILTEKGSPFSVTVKRQATLCLSSSISKTLVFYQHIWEYLIEDLKTSANEQDQLLNIYALRNANMGKSDPEFIKMAKGSNGYENLTPHARSEAMYGLQSTSEDEDCLWLLLLNKTESFEVRSAAIHLLMDKERSENYEKMVWSLINDEDKNIKHLLYTKLKSISETKLPSLSARRTRAKQLLSRLKKPRKSIVKASSYIQDFFDESTGIGNTIQLTYYGNLGSQNFTQIHLRIALLTSAPKWEQYDWHINLRRNSNKRVKFNNLFDLVKDSNYDGLIYSVVYVKNGYVVSWRDHTIEDLIWMLNSFNVNNYFADITQRNNVIVSTDMGIPVIFAHHRSYIFRIQSSFERASSGKFSLDFVFRGIETYGFKSYNYAVDLRNGITRVQSVDGNFPLEIEFDAEPVNGKMNMTLKIGDEPFGFQAFSYGNVFVKDDSSEQIFSKLCPHCGNFDFVTNGENKLENLVILEGDQEDVGLQYELNVFDCEQRLKASYFPWDGRNIVGNLLKLIVPSARCGMCGVGLKIKKSDKYPATHLDVTVDEGEISTDRTVTWSRSSANVSYNIKNDGKLIKSWDISFKMSTSDGSEYELDLELKSTKKDVPQDLLTFQAKDIWGNDAMNAFRKISFNSSMESKYFMIASAASNDFEGKRIPDIDKVFMVCDLNSRRTFGDCLREVSSYRSYKSVVCYSELNSDQMYYLKKISDFFMFTYAEEFVRMNGEYSSANCFILKTAYALYHDNINVTVVTPEETYRYDDIYLGKFYFLPHVVPYSKLMLYNYVEPRYCEMDSNFITDAQDGDKYNLKYTNDGWAYLAAQCHIYYKNCRWLVKTKKVEGTNDLVMHFQMGVNVIIVSHNGSFHITLNGKELALKQYNVLTNVVRQMDIMVMADHRNRTSRVILRMQKEDVIAEYTRERVRLSLPWHFVGQCYIEE